MTRSTAACSASSRKLPPMRLWRYFGSAPWLRSSATSRASVVVVGRDQAGVAERAEVLAREERKAARRAHRPRLPRLVARADRLRGVLDDGDARRAGDCRGADPCRRRDRTDAPAMIARVRGVSAARTPSGSRLNVAGSMSTSTGVAPSRATQPAVAKNEYVVRDDLVAGADAERHQRASSASVPDDTVTACRRLERTRRARLERLDLGPEDEALAVADARRSRRASRRAAAGTAPGDRAAERWDPDYRAGARTRQNLATVARFSAGVP